MSGGSASSAWIAGIAEQSPADLKACHTPIEANAVAVKAAAEDADMPLGRIDALLSYDSLVAPDIMQANRIGDYLGISPWYLTTIGAAGATPALMVALASSMVRSGMATTVAIAHSDMRAASGPSSAVIGRMANTVGNKEFEDPFGGMVPTFYSFLAEWMLATDRATREDFAEVAVQARAWAGLNPNARKTTPLTAEEVLSTPPLAGPLGRYDCCLITDFSGALIVTGEQPPGNRAAVRIAGISGAASHEEILQLPGDDPLAAATDAAARLYAATGVGADDIDCAYLYDSFTVTVALQLLAYGLDRGRGLHALLSGTGTGPGGGFPVNTHGGLLSATTSGLFHVIEAVRQLRGDAGPRQVEGLRTALVSNVGGVFSNHCSLILRGGHDG